MRIDIDNVAHLANLHLSEAEKTTYLPQLQNILALAEAMNAVNTDAITPMAHPLDAVQPMRADEVSYENQRELFQSIAPNTASGLYLVPLVIDPTKQQETDDA